jgi:hypothetical protein
MEYDQILLISEISKVPVVGREEKVSSRRSEIASEPTLRNGWGFSERLLRSCSV